ncbi:hypothetical protein [Terricaulis sp.]|uniref:hypothetical protein n=1 Tax=Terricaulis sp. TaxID=2768686 RepID=UPI002AC52C8F|nr:hypothetical protein [Terricaulis sp.]MDZ4691951.1 hypothetical protein [Terricaulis sp.]
MKLKRGLSRIWPALYQMKLVRAHMPFWRVVVEARLEGRSKKWPRKFGSAVTAVFVWARTIEEAEGLAVLALEEEGLATLTADAKKTPPAAAPRRIPAAVARTELGFLPRLDGETSAEGPSRRDARA